MDKADFEEWGVIALFGHVQYAGKVTGQSIGACSFVRLDVPEGTGRPAFCKLFGEKAIYDITITDEKTARSIANNLTPLPLPKWSGETFVQRQQRERMVDGADEDPYVPGPGEDT